MSGEYKTRQYFFIVLLLVVLLIISARLFSLQILGVTFKQNLTQYSVRRNTLYPSRGIIFDRNKKIIVQNEPIYDLYITPYHLEITDTAFLMNIFNLTKEGMDDRIREAKIFSLYQPSLFQKQIDHKTFSILQEKLWLNKGFTYEVKTVRQYTHPVGAQALGYIAEVNKKQMESGGGYYKLGEYIGTSGIEKTYEKYLRGKKGVRNILVDVHDKEFASFEDGKYDTLAISGEDLICTLDLDLQEFAESLMKNKTGSIVAIEPSTGEILCLVSSPSYDPNLLSGSSLGKNFSDLTNDKTNPLFVRPIMAQYPPGSTYKLISALAAQQDGFLTTETRYSCGGGFSVGNILVKCMHNHPALNLTESIQHSCNAYYCRVFYNFIENKKFNSPQEGYLKWRKYMSAFGMGKKIGIDLPDEWSGILYTKEKYDAKYGVNKWKASTIISLGIGQGEMGMTPLQMANVMCIIANRGYYIQPHLVRSRISKDGRQSFDFDFEKKNVPVDSIYFENVIEGMQLAVQAGTAAGSKIDSVIMCGKTGTAENYTVINGRRVQLKDHSVFVAFAPRENPKIAIVVIVENGGWGSVTAAPIVSLVVQKYLLERVTRPDLLERILNMDTIHGTGTTKIQGTD